MWNSKELGKTRCRGCYDSVPRYELIQTGYCLKCREMDNSNYKLTDWERSSVESRRLERLKELKDKPKKTENDYLKILSDEYDMPELGGYETVETAKLVECVSCKKKLEDWSIICSEETDWKNICARCLIEKEQQEAKIEIPPKNN